MVDQEGWLPRYGWVYYDPNGIANILSLDNVAKKSQVVFNSGKDKVFHVHGPMEVVEFRCSQDGLYYYNTTGVRHATFANYSVKTVAANIKGFT